jgi:hypothetical protein
MPLFRWIVDWGMPNWGKRQPNSKSPGNLVAFQNSTLETAVAAAGALLCLCRRLVAACGLPVCWCVCWWCKTT